MFLIIKLSLISVLKFKKCFEQYLYVTRMWTIIVLIITITIIGVGRGVG